MRTWQWLWMCLVLLLACVPVHSEEMVTIPKSRLEELERKAAELDRIKGDLGKVQRENVQLKQVETELKQQRDKAVAAAAEAGKPVHVSPPMASLPPLAPGAVVDAKDLGNYFKADPAAAEKRFRKQKFRVRGEIVGFEKPLVIRNYKVLLATADRGARVVCDFWPPEFYKAVYTIKNGTQLVGVAKDDSRTPLAKIGDVFTIEGMCKGGKDGLVQLTGCRVVGIE